LAAAVLFFGIASPARADIVIVLTDSLGHETAVEISPTSNPNQTLTYSNLTGTNGVLASPSDGVKTDLTITVSTAIGTLSNGTAFLDLGISASGASAALIAAGGQLQVTAYDTGYSLVGSPGGGTANFTFNNTTTSSSSSAYYDKTNTGNGSAPAPTAPPGITGYSLPAGFQLLGSLSSPPSVNHSIQPFSVSPLISPFALIVQQTLVFGSSTQTASTDDSITLATPAPAGLVLALTGLPCLGVGSWIRRRMLKAA